MGFSDTLSSMFLLINSLALFTLTWMLIKDVLLNFMLHETLIVSTVFHLSLVLSAVVGALFNRKLREKKILSLWIMLGASTYLLSPIIIDKMLFKLIIAALTLGVSVGTGIPICLAFFADYTDIKKRGLAGSAIFFTTQVFTVLIYSSMSNLLITEKFLIVGIWRLLGVLGVFFYVPIRALPGEKGRHTLLRVVSDRAFILYFIPWLLFCLINFVEAPLLETFLGPALFDIYLIVGIITNGVFAFLGGIICDFKGRKTTSIISFILLGISYALLSIFQGAHFSMYVFMLLEGMAWGMLYVVFVFVIWGDLSERGIREKYYLIGSMPYLLSSWIGTAVKPVTENIPIYTSFSLTSFFLFLAVLPLLYAPETLPEKMLKDRELRSYIEKAKRVREKFTKG